MSGIVEPDVFGTLVLANTLKVTLIVNAVSSSRHKTDSVALKSNSNLRVVIRKKLRVSSHSAVQILNTFYRYY